MISTYGQFTNIQKKYILPYLKFIRNLVSIISKWSAALHCESFLLIRDVLPFVFYVDEGVQ